MTLTFHYRGFLFDFTVLILSSYSSWRGRRIRSSQFTHVWVFISLWGAGWILHLIIFNYRSLQSTEKNVGQTSSTIFLFLAERHSKPDRWETSLKCVFDSLCSIWAPKLSSFQLNLWAPLVQEDKLERKRSAQLSDPVQNNLGNTLRTQGLADLSGSPDWVVQVRQFCSIMRPYSPHYTVRTFGARWSLAHHPKEGYTVGMRKNVIFSKAITIRLNGKCYPLSFFFHFNRSQQKLLVSIPTDFIGKTIPLISVTKSIS